ncbi:MAG: NifB/NifX family molybdenum-iron cluster-binding protein [Clostridium sp.]|nr:NifB/NifX family molybdenum-iron cluster-binding protein [Clostridium sp.]
MKIALPKNESEINQHFGKSKSFEIITIEDKKIADRKEISAEALQHNHEGLASLLKAEGVSVVITGGIGQGAIEGLKSENLSIIRGASGKIDDIVSSYINGELVDKNVVCNHDHDHHDHKSHATIKMPNMK